MYPTMQHLNDEHMRLYEWSGAGAETRLLVTAPKKSKRTHAWHASYGVLALLVSLLGLTSCDSKGPVEQAGDQVDQAIKDMQTEDARSQQLGTTPARPEAAAPAPDGAQRGSELPKQ